MRVLVVEDEIALAEGIRRGLEAEGFATDVAHDGTDGLSMALEHAYDAIVLDIMLPGLNGFRVCAAIRQAEVWTPILILTAKDGEYDEAEALDTGADDYVTKPFSYVALGGSAACADPPWRGRAARTCSRRATCGSIPAHGARGVGRPRCA